MNKRYVITQEEINLKALHAKNKGEIRIDATLNNQQKSKMFNDYLDFKKAVESI